MTILVMGGASFIGSNFVLDLWAQSSEPVVNVDKLTAEGNLGTLASRNGNLGHTFVQGYIGARTLLDGLLAIHCPRAIANFAAESHFEFFDTWKQ